MLLVALTSSFADYLAACHGFQDTFDFPSEEEAKAFDQKLKALSIGPDGRVNVLTEQRGARVVAWLASRPKKTT